MVQGASQTAARFPETMRYYKAPPPEISSEQFYETDESRGFARGFSIQTVGPQPIDWALHDGLGSYFWQHNWGSPKGFTHPAAHLHQVGTVQPRAR